MNHAKRTDSNHAAIRDGLRQVYGKDAVIDKSMCGYGVPDLMVTTPGGHTIWLELKMPGEKLTPDELVFRNHWAVVTFTVRSLEEAIERIQDVDMEA